MGLPLRLSGQGCCSAQWWLSLTGAPAFQSRADAGPSLFVDHRDNPYGASFKPQMRSAPLGRWFKISAAVREGVSIEWYVDDVLFETSLDGDAGYSDGATIGRRYFPDAGYAFSVGHSKGYGWILVTDAKVSELPR
jgi:hypothetical protein